jgi:hypothetical protein
MGGADMSSTDKSPSPRVPLKLEVEYRKSYGRNGETGELKNISLTGAFLEHSNEALGINDKVCVTFKVGGRIRKINAMIVWSTEDGAGIKFLPRRANRRRPHLFRRVEARKSPRRFGEHF